MLAFAAEDAPIDSDDFGTVPEVVSEERESARAVAERQLAAEQERAREERLAALEREEDERREAERLERELEEDRALAAAEAAELAELRRVLEEQAEEVLAALLRTLGELSEVDRQQHAARGRADARAGHDPRRAGSWLGRRPPGPPLDADRPRRPVGRSEPRDPRPAGPQRTHNNAITRRLVCGWPAPAGWPSRAPTP